MNSLMRRARLTAGIRHVCEAQQFSIQHAAVRGQLERILAHTLFNRSERMGRFLRLAVERTLDGRADEVKEYLIGVEVFDRRASYDPRVDPIVRVEARRLRSKLKDYYDAEGRTDPIVIEFPRGSYVPHFRELTETPEPVSAPASVAAPCQTRLRSGVAATAVLPLVNLSANPDNEYFSNGLTEELIHALTKLPSVRVVAWSTEGRPRDRQQDLHAICQQLHVDTVLTGSVRIAGSSLRVCVQLIDTETGVYLRSETFDRQMQDVFAIQEEIALAIVRTMRVQLTGDPAASLITRGPIPISSYGWYPSGRYLGRANARQRT